MNSEPLNKVQKKSFSHPPNEITYSLSDAISELNDLKDIALNCLDKNGNPNISAAIKVVETKAKLAGLFSKTNIQIGQVVKMNEITIDGEQLKLNIGEDYFL